MYSLGIDIGSSSIKGAVIDIETGKVAAHGFYPRNEMEIISPAAGFAEQNPDTWWENIKSLTNSLIKENKLDAAQIQCIGIAYQMHGLVAVGTNNLPLRNAIIWCDSRGVEIGEQAFSQIGAGYCLNNLLNSPGNFTASKLKWVKDNEPIVFGKINKILLPGDYIALKMTGEAVTTIPGLSEGMFWDYVSNSVSEPLMNYFGFEMSILPELRDTFSIQGYLSGKAAAELGLKKGIPVSYRAGDQPNNAFSLNALNPGEIAATAGTSGVVYAVTENPAVDNFSRINNFAHVNYKPDEKRIGVLLCINGTGILNSWVRKYLADKCTYSQMNLIAELAGIGSKGISVLPFGNGAERMLRNRNLGSHIMGLDFNSHSIAHIFRGSQEGVAFAFRYGIDLMKELGIAPSVIRAANANMFLSETFRQTLADAAGVTISLYDTDGAQGAARGAALGGGFYKSPEEAFSNLRQITEITPLEENLNPVNNAYGLWLDRLNTLLK